MKIGAIIQARTSSSRLPKKVLKPLPFNGDVTVLQHVIRRVLKSKLIDEVIVATTHDVEDEEIVSIAKKENVKYFRGSLENVLERYYNAASENNLDVIVRITSDNPCVDFEIIDQFIESHIDNFADYTSNLTKGDLPVGMSVEIINFDSLKKAYENAEYSYEKEHVTPFIYKSHPEFFKINNIIFNINVPDIRLTLDTFQDYALISIIYENLTKKNEFFNLNDILGYFKEKPYLKYINSSVFQKNQFNNLNEELEKLVEICDTYELMRAKKFIENQVGLNKK